jgi:hypothetical protein
MHMRNGITILILLFSASAGVFGQQPATAAPIPLIEWNQLSRVAINDSVTLTRTDGERVTGRLVDVRPDTLVLSIGGAVPAAGPGGQSQAAAAPKVRTIQRSDVTALTVRVRNGVYTAIGGTDPVAAQRAIATWRVGGRIAVVTAAGRPMRGRITTIGPTQFTLRQGDQLRVIEYAEVRQVHPVAPLRATTVVILASVGVVVAAIVHSALNGFGAH